MLTIKLNGKEKKLYIGCRTFLTLDELLEIISAEAAAVTINGNVVAQQNFSRTNVRGGDALILSPAA